MDYSFVPQMYQQGLQPGLQEQFRLAEEATPVSQFLKGLMSQRQLQMHQQQLDQIAQRWNEDRDYRVNRDAINDQRYRDIAAQNSEDRQMGIQQHADSARERATSKLFEDFSANFDGSPEMASYFKQRFDSLGVPMPGVHKNQALKAKYAYEKNPDFVGPQTPSPDDAETPVVDMPDETYSPGAGYQLKRDAEDRKTEFGQTKLEIDRAYKEGRISVEQYANAIRALNVNSLVGHRSVMEGIAQDRATRPPTDRSNPTGSSLVAAWIKDKGSGATTLPFDKWVVQQGLKPRGGAPAPVAQAAPAQSAGPKVGDIVKGYRFKGGNPASPSSWEKAE